MSSELPQVHIASFVLLVNIAAMPEVLRHLALLPTVEVAAHDQNGKIVLLIEAEHERRIADLADAIRDLRGVLSLSMVEHHMDDALSMAEELQS
jgi:nitrate reductase NapD